MFDGRDGKTLAGAGIPRPCSAERSTSRIAARGLPGAWCQRHCRRCSVRENRSVRIVVLDGDGNEHGHGDVNGDEYPTLVPADVKRRSIVTS